MMPPDPRAALKRAITEAKKSACSGAPSEILYRYAAIDRLSHIALLCGRIEQAEADMWIAHSDSGCEGSPSERELGRLAAFAELSKERDRLIAELKEVEE